MKVRLDFVTNSSSSSYIFKDKEEFEKTYKRMCKKKSDWFDDVWDRYSIELLPIRQFGADPLEEVFCWYLDNIYKKIFEDYPMFACEYNREYDVYEEAENQFYEKLEKKGLSDEELERLALILLFKCMMDRIGFVKSDKVIPKKVSDDEFAEYIWDILSGRRFLHDRMLEFAVFHYCMRIVELAKPYEDKEAGEILELLLDAKYMYYDDMETPMKTDEWLRAIKDCVYACNHMG